MCSISDSNGKIIEQYKVPYGATLEVASSTSLEDEVRIAFVLNSDKLMKAINIIRLALKEYKD